MKKKKERKEFLIYYFVKKNDVFVVFPFFFEKTNRDKNEDKFLNAFPLIFFFFPKLQGFFGSG